MSDGKVNVKKGLEGVVIDTTSVSKVMPESNSLTYKGYPVQDLAEKCTFEDVAYLLWNDELPNEEQAKEFKAKERSYRALPDSVLNAFKGMDMNGHPMDILRTGVSILGSDDKRTWDETEEITRDKATHMLAKIPTMIAAAFRMKHGKEVIPPDTSLSMAENFFKMCFGEVPAKEVVKAFDVSLILYAEHSFNASTFAARVITSTTSDIYSAVCGGIGALKGPLHGGANEQVMYVLKEVGEVEGAKEWMQKALVEKRKVMGFGHRVYKNGDSRVPTMKKYAKKMAEFVGEPKWMDISQALEDVMVKEKNIYPNLDFPAGPAYYMMGFEIDMFTPIFVMSRITGWSAHILEQSANNRIIRPLSEYIGPKERSL
jgi:2-methylcitrate synthase